MIVFIFPQKIGFDFSCKLFPKKEKIHKMSKPISGKNKKNINLSLAKS